MLLQPSTFGQGAFTILILSFFSPICIWTVISGYWIYQSPIRWGFPCGVGARCLCKNAGKEQGEWMWQGGNASRLCGWVTLATVTISHNSGRWHTSIGPSGICLGFGIFGSRLLSLRISLLLTLFLAGLSCGGVWSYDGELKWSGRKSYWCLSKYHTWVHLDWTKYQFPLLNPFIICVMSCLN